MAEVSGRTGERIVSGGSGSGGVAAGDDQTIHKYKYWSQTIVTPYTLMSKRFGRELDQSYRFTILPVILRSSQTRIALISYHIAELRSGSDF
jgi:hypothetical protein